MSSLLPGIEPVPIATVVSSSFVLPPVNDVSELPLGVSIKDCTFGTLAQSYAPGLSTIMFPSLPSNELGESTASEPETKRISATSATPSSATERRVCCLNDFCAASALAFIRTAPLNPVDDGPVQELRARVART